MTKVFIVPGFNAYPNSSWFPWLMSELKKLDIYTCALPMPSPDNPVCSQWVEELSRHINASDQIYLVGHSIGCLAIMRFLEKTNNQIAGCILVSCHSEKNSNHKIDSFFETPFDYKNIAKHAKKIVIIHSDNDPFVPLENAQTNARELNCQLIVIPGGGHFTGSGGWRTFPECLEVLKGMMNVVYYTYHRR